jgi:hypothetical protein
MEATIEEKGESKQEEEEGEEEKEEDRGEGRKKQKKERKPRKEASPEKREEAALTAEVRRLAGLDEKTKVDAFMLRQMLRKEAGVLAGDMPPRKLGLLQLAVDWLASSDARKVKDIRGQR